MQIIMVKQTDETLTEPAAGIMRKFLFEFFEGATEKDSRAWKRFWKSMNEACLGEYFTLKIERQRSGPFHRLTFAMLQAVFKAQDRFDDMRVFRQFAKLGAGFVDYIPNADGELRAVPKSQSFDECSEEECRELFDNFKAFFRTARCCKTLWPDALVNFSEIGMEQILSEFERDK